MFPQVLFPAPVTFVCLHENLVKIFVLFFLKNEHMNLNWNLRKKIMDLKLTASTQ